MMPDREWSHGLHVPLLPLQDDVLRERPAPLRPDAQSARLIMRV